MSTQVSTWPKSFYQTADPIAAKSATGQGEMAVRPPVRRSAFEHVPAIAFSAVFAAELAFVAGGIGILVASLATLFLQGALR